MAKRFSISGFSNKIKLNKNKDKNKDKEKSKSNFNFKSKKIDINAIIPPKSMYFNLKTQQPPNPVNVEEYTATRLPIEDPIIGNPIQIDNTILYLSQTLIYPEIDTNEKKEKNVDEKESEKKNQNGHQTAAETLSVSPQSGSTKSVPIIGQSNNSESNPTIITSDQVTNNVTPSPDIPDKQGISSKQEDEDKSDSKDEEEWWDYPVNENEITLTIYDLITDEIKMEVKIDTSDYKIDLEQSVYIVDPNPKFNKLWLINKNKEIYTITIEHQPKITKITDIYSGNIITADQNIKVFPSIGVYLGHIVVVGAVPLRQGIQEKKKVMEKWEIEKQIKEEEERQRLEAMEEAKKDDEADADKQLPEEQAIAKEVLYLLIKFC